MLICGRCYDEIEHHRAGKCQLCGELLCIHCIKWDPNIEKYVCPECSTTCKYELECANSEHLRETMEQEDPEFLLDEEDREL